MQAEIANSNEGIIQHPPDLEKIEYQLNHLFSSVGRGGYYFPPEKLDHASIFIVSQREVLKRLSRKSLQINIHNEHPVTKFLNFHDENSFRTATFELKREFLEFAKQMKAINRVCSATHMSAEQFDLYSLNVYAKPNKNIGMPFRNWRIGDFINVTCAPLGQGFMPVFVRKPVIKTRDVEISSYVIENGFGDLLSVFAEFGKICLMVRGNLIHRVQSFKQIKQKNEKENVIINIKRIEPVLHFVIPIFLEYANLMLDVRHAVVSNKPWKQPKFIY